MSLDQAFLTFTGGAADMDGRTFVKILKDNKIIDSKFTSTDADLIFAKVKAKGERKISFPQFTAAIAAVAERKKLPVEDIEAKLESGKGPVLSGTKAEANRFHDDKSLYTGVHGHGGPSTKGGGTGGVADISQLVDRTAADVRGRKIG
eukprot:Platyproteum_vivax@DN5614_c0_g1_i1.p1